MKTSELKSWLKDKYAFQEFNGFIIIEGNIEVGVTLGWLRILTQNFNTLRNLTLLEKVLEYAKTPLEEREDKEKKYLLAINVANKKYYLLKNENKKDFHLVTTPYAYKTEFTQEEIDLLNFDLSKFIKEEVQ